MHNATKSATATAPPPAATGDDKPKSKRGGARKPREGFVKVAFEIPSEEHATLVKMADEDDRGPNDLGRVFTRTAIRNYTQKASAAS
jgi:hypothetical protein